jgi:hypothetical protein
VPKGGPAPQTKKPAGLSPANFLRGYFRGPWGLHDCHEDTELRLTKFRAQPLSATRKTHERRFDSICYLHSWDWRRCHLAGQQASAKMVGAALFARAIRDGASVGALIVITAVSGSVFIFVDFLVNPPWMPMLLAFLVVASNMAITARQKAIIAIGCVATWFAAYSLTWFTKWVVAWVADPEFAFKSDVRAHVKAFDHDHNLRTRKRRLEDHLKRILGAEEREKIEGELMKIDIAGIPKPAYRAEITCAGGI